MPNRVNIREFDVVLLEYVNIGWKYLKIRNSCIILEYYLANIPEFREPCSRCFIYLFNRGDFSINLSALPAVIYRQ